MRALGLADRDQLGLATGMIEHALADQPVVKNNVGGFQRAHRLHGEQLGVAGAGADQQHAAARVLLCRSLFDRRADQGAGLVLVAFEHGLGGGAFEHRLPEFPPRPPRGQLLGDRPAELGGELGQRIEPGMQLLLQPGAQPLGQHGRHAGRADRHRDLAAIDDGRQRKGAKLGPVGHVHRHAKGAGDGRNAGILLIVLGRGDHQRTAAQLIDAGPRGNERHLPRFGERGKFRTQLIGGDIDRRGALQQEPGLDRGELAASGHQRRLAVEADKNGEGPHGAILPPPRARPGYRPGSQAPARLRARPAPWT